MMHLKNTIEFRITACPCVYVKTIMFMNAKSKNGEYVIKTHGIVLILFCDWVCLYINTNTNLKSLTI